jgi:type VI protein secretion system component Hcp
MLNTNYLKKNDDNEQVNTINKNVEKKTKTDNNKQQSMQQALHDLKNSTQSQQISKAPRDRKIYLNEYYEKNTQKMKEKIKNNEKEKTCKLRLLREINNGLNNIKPVRASTLAKS